MLLISAFSSGFSTLSPSRAFARREKRECNLATARGRGEREGKTNDEPNVPNLDRPILRPTDEPFRLCMPSQTRHIRRMTRQSDQLSVSSVSILIN